MVVDGLAVGELAVSGAYLVEKWIVFEVVESWFAGWMKLVPSVH